MGFGPKLDPEQTGEDCVKMSLYVTLEAKPGRVKRKASDFPRTAVLVMLNWTITWSSMGPSSFAIFDTFDDEAGRNVHLNGKVAAALMEKARPSDVSLSRRFTSSIFL